MSHDLAAIVKLLSSNDRAVDRAMLVLFQTAMTDWTAGDVSDVRYFASWVSQGNRLSGDYLARARKLAIRFAPILVARAAKKEATIVPSVLKLEREGQFKIRTVPGTDHCGTLAAFDVKYHVKLETLRDLDSRGFLADQTLIDRYFQNLSSRPVAVSCERLAEDSLRGVRSVLLADNPRLRIQTLDVTLSPAPFAARLTCHLLGLDG